MNHGPFGISLFHPNGPWFLASGPDYGLGLASGQHQASVDLAENGRALAG